MTQKIDLSKRVPIRIDFLEDEVKKFKYVKKHLGLKQNTEVIRALISSKYNEIQISKQKQKAQLLKERKALELLEKGEYQCPM